MMPRPGPASAGPILPGLPTDTDFGRINGAGCIATMRGTAACPLAPSQARAGRACSIGVPAAIGLTLDDPLGELNQHPFGPVILQFVKRPQQPQIEQRLQRTAVLRR